MGLDSTVLGWLLLMLLVVAVAAVSLVARLRRRSLLIPSQILEALPEAMVIVDRNGVVVVANRAARALFRSDELAGKRLDEHLGTLDLDWVLREQAADGTVAEEREIEFVREGDFSLWLSVASSSVAGVSGVLVRLRDITDQKLLEAQLRFQAGHDHLTSLPNRATAQMRLAQALDRAIANQGEAAVLLVDLDGFKAINDRHGHAAGDRVLEAAAERMLDCVRGEDTVARLGGDEFLIVLAEVHGQAGVRSVAQRIVTALAQPIELADTSVRVTASVGGAIAGAPHIGTTSELVEAADRAMYVAKRAGGGQIRVVGGAATGHRLHASGSEAPR